MAHVFISYKRSEKSKRDEIYHFLRDFLFENEIKFDEKTIEGGEEWIKAIDIMLIQFFAVLVIVTEKSMKSNYVTYEWSWAMGYGIPVIPIVFADFPITSKKVHAKLRNDIHGLEFPREQEKLKNDLIRCKKDSPLVIYLQTTISKELFSVQLFVALFFHLLDKLYQPNFNYELFKQLRQTLTIIILHTYRDNLPRFWLQYSHSFTFDIKRKFEAILDSIDDFWHQFVKLDVEIENEDFLYQKVDFLKEVDECKEFYKDNILEPSLEFPYVSSIANFIKILENYSDMSEVQQFFNNNIIYIINKYAEDILSEIDKALLDKIVEYIKNN